MAVFSYRLGFYCEEFSNKLASTLQSILSVALGEMRIAWLLLGKDFYGVTFIWSAGILGKWIIEGEMCDFLSCY